VQATGSTYATLNSKQLTDGASPYSPRFSLMGGLCGDAKASFTKFRTKDRAGHAQHERTALANATPPTPYAPFKGIALTRESANPAKCLKWLN
jgi:hypothetical protein